MDIPIWFSILMVFLLGYLVGVVVEAVTHNPVFGGKGVDMDFIRTFWTVVAFVIIRKVIESTIKGKQNKYLGEPKK